MTTMRRIALVVLVLAVLVPAEVAQAGGWATVELGESPSGLQTGEPWRVELIVKQHGVTPMEGLQPSITIVNDAGVERTFPARGTSRVGHYVADVEFPSSGMWRARISDGFTNAVPHRISRLSVSETPAAVPAGFPWPQTVMIGLVVLLFLGGWIAAGGSVLPRERRAARGGRRPTPRAVA